MAKVTNGVKNIVENFNQLSRVHERCRQTDRRQTDGSAYSERECEFTFAKNSHLKKLAVGYDLEAHSRSPDMV